MPAADWDIFVFRDVLEFSEGDKLRFLIDFAVRLYRGNRDALHV